ncbi:aminodeoxychorismate lyase [Psychrobacter urativorans]|uniref:branched-chain-amino-acid transaminase n=1 Tax=Psychrobacter urativorans TaxID=45610 RepID=A0A0M5MK66_9GAMM|nr:aminodeoxychorismate lyase [Psychrobacter urativorans]
MKQTNSWICLQSQATASLDKPLNSVSLDSRGLAYGDGFFTTMGVIDGAILWQDYHRQRIRSHATALQLDIDSDALCIDLQIHAKQLQQGVLKLIITRAPQAVRGYGFTPKVSGSQCKIWLKAMPMNIATIDQWQLPNGHLVPMQPVIPAACLTAQLACFPPPLAGLKSLNRLDNVLASGELQRLNQTAPNLDKKFGEGLVRDMTGSWIEGTMSNIFYRLNSQKQTSATAEQFDNTQWFTPPLEHSGVRGVMRTVIMEGFATSTTPIMERPLRDEDLPKLSQLFFCNALRGIMPVSSLTLLTGEVINFA